MPQLVVPDVELEEPWPTLGPQVCDWIEAHLVRGPGDLRGDPVVLSDEETAWIWRLYEVFPPGHRRAGRRRFKRGCLMVRKGLAKTELAALLGLAELHPEAPVRCDGFDADGEPVGRGVRDPYIPMVAYTEEQTEDLAYGAARVILEESVLADEFDIGLERIKRPGGGEMKPLASSPSARDGARTTFQHFDETHRFTLESLLKAHRTMLANVPKRKQADAWSLETTTAYAPGERSVAEQTHEFARKVADGTVREPNLFFFFRWAGDQHDVKTKKGRRGAVREATGPSAIAWTDLDAIVAEWDDPESDHTYLERVWCNRIVSPPNQWMDPLLWAACRHPAGLVLPPDGTTIGLGFDGSYSNDSTALFGCTQDEHVFEIGVWERDPRDPDWTVSRAEVDAAVHRAFSTWDVGMFWLDPSGWRETVEGWQTEFGDDVVDPMPNTDQRMAPLCDDFLTAVRDRDGLLTHDGSMVLARHIGNARAKTTRWGTTIVKESKTSQRKIDAAVAAIHARGAALAIPEPAPSLVESVW